MTNKKEINLDELEKVAGGSKDPDEKITINCLIIYTKNDCIYKDPYSFSTTRANYARDVKKAYEYAQQYAIDHGGKYIDLKAIDE